MGTTDDIIPFSSCYDGQCSELSLNNYINFPQLFSSELVYVRNNWPQDSSLHSSYLQVTKGSLPG